MSKPHKITIDLDAPEVQAQPDELTIAAEAAGYSDIESYLAAMLQRLARETRIHVATLGSLIVRYARYETGNMLVVYADEGATVEVRRYDRGLLNVMKGDPDPAYGAALMAARWYRIVWLEAV